MGGGIKDHLKPGASDSDASVVVPSGSDPGISQPCLGS